MELTNLYYNIELAVKEALENGATEDEIRSVVEDALKFKKEETQIESFGLEQQVDASGDYYYL